MVVELKFRSFIQGVQNKVQMSLVQVDEENRNVCSFSKLVVFFATPEENIWQNAYKRVFRFRETGFRIHFHACNEIRVRGRFSSVGFKHNVDASVTDYPWFETRSVTFWECR